MEDNKKSISPNNNLFDTKYTGTISGRSSIQSYIDEMNKIESAAIEKYIRMSGDTFRMSEEQRPKVDRLKSKRKELQSYIDKIDRCIEQSQNLNFKDGDVIYSKDYGPVVVSEVVVDIEDPSYSLDGSGREPFKFYYKGFSKVGQVSIKAEEALPYNETTKLLYEKKK